MAKKAYVGVNGLARNITKMYVGINGVAHKIKAAYVGVNGVARKFFGGTPATNFTTSPLPRNWSGEGVAANTVYTASNTLGEWKCYADQKFGSTTQCWKMFDGDANTTAITNAYTAATTAVLELPTGIYIKPTQLTMVLGSYFGKNSTVQGRRRGTTTWDTFYTQASGTGSTTTTNVTQPVSTNYFYDQFRVVYTGASSYHPRIKELDITAGTIDEH